MIERGNIIDNRLILASDDGFSPTLAEFKAHLQLTSDSQNGVLLVCLKAAIGHAGSFIGKIIAPTECRYTGAFASAIKLTQALSVTSVKVDGDLLTSDQYLLRDGVLIFGGTVTGEYAEVDFVAGMRVVPDAVRSAILLIGADLFLHRDNQVKTLPSMAEYLLRPHRSWGMNE